MAKKQFPVSPFAPADVFVIYSLAKDVADLRENERIGVRPSEITKLISVRQFDKYVIRQPVTVQNKDYYYAHCLLRAVDRNVMLASLQKEFCCQRDETFVSPAKLLSSFKQYPSIVMNTYRLLEECSIEMDFEKDKTKQVYGGSKEEDMHLLEKISTGGLARRYGKKNKTAVTKLKDQLSTIRDMNFGAYFLIAYDFIRFADSQDFYHVGRGSGANSLVAYCMSISDVDPIELNLTPERFLNPERTSPPDFDIDFSHAERDEVMDYIFQRYGKKHVALLGSCPTFKHDSIIRQLGKVYGITDEEIKALQYSGTPTCDKTRKIVKYGTMIKGFPYNPSIHPCGMLITEEPIYNYMSLFMPPKGFQTALMDMFTAEDIGINKFDVLSQRGLSHIKDALRLVKQNRNIRIDIHDYDTFYNDPEIRKRVMTGDTIGCFYVESPAMRGLLRKLQCPDYLTLVAASSIIRPGVSSSGMMRAYIERFHNRDLIDYIHPVFEEHLSETYGVMVYQEDVMIIAHHYGGLSMGKADILRRAMSGKYRSSNHFEMVKDEFFASATALGREPAQVAEVWRQMVSFAGYSFNKAHSASFAKESYMSLHLKTHYPCEFMVAVINNMGGFYSTQLYFLELRKAGANIHLPCINESNYETNINGTDVYVGFMHIKDLQDKNKERILDERKQNGAYLHLQDFIERTNITREQLIILVRIGAFRFTGKGKKYLLWEANYLQAKNEQHVATRNSLFLEPPLELVLPELLESRVDDLYDEIEILGFPLANPFDMVDEDPDQYQYAKDLPEHLGKNITLLLYFIADKTVPTVTEKTMAFGCFMDAHLDWVDTVHFPDSLNKYPLHGGGFYKTTGKVVEDFGVYSVEVHHMKKIGYKQSSYYQ